MNQKQPFELPQQLRDLAENNVEQGRAAYAQFMDAMTQASSMWMGAMPANEMTHDLSFGAWVQQRRLALDLTRPALALVARHRDAGDRVLLTTATCRFLSEPSAAHLGITDLIATECGLDAHGRFSGRSRGTLNMRDGKVQRLHDWLADQGLALADVASTLYSDSINDLPLLSAVNHAVAVDPDPRLAQEAERRGWATMSLR